jgi:fermentation-respiration switch protein FrsA (DUF1100 family)
MKMTTATAVSPAGHLLAGDGVAATGFAGGERVTFESQGETIVGRVFAAAFGDPPRPAVVIIGPACFQKEQVPALYAPRFAELGFTRRSFLGRSDSRSG